MGDGKDGLGGGRGGTGGQGRDGVVSAIRAALFLLRLSLSMFALWTGSTEYQRATDLCIVFFFVAFDFAILEVEDGAELGSTILR